MRKTHNGKPLPALSEPRRRCYLHAMKTTLRFSRGLRAAALILFLAGVGVWAAGGARVGWTQTSTVALQRDEITGIDYPVRRDAFLPGVEIPLAATAFATLLAALSLIRPRPQLTARN